MHGTSLYCGGLLPPDFSQVESDSTQFIRFPQWRVRGKSFRPYSGSPFQWAHCGLQHPLFLSPSDLQVSEKQSTGVIPIDVPLRVNTAQGTP